jgi:hypothetical protein
MHTPFWTSLRARKMRKALRASNKWRKAIGGWRFALKEALHEDGTVTAVDPTQVVDPLATVMTSRHPFPNRMLSAGLDALGTRRFLLEATATNEMLMAAAEMKRLAGQINVVIHSLGPATYPRSRRAS